MQVFSCEICKFSQKTFFTEQLQWLLLWFNWQFQRTPEQKVVRLSTISTIFSCKKVSAPTKIQKPPPQVFCKKRSATLLLERGSSIAKFLRTLIFKNICERLILKISISVTNSEAVVQKCSVKKVFLEISQNSQENTCATASFLIKLQALGSFF